MNVNAKLQGPVQVSRPRYTRQKLLNLTVKESRRERSREEPEGFNEEELSTRQVVGQRMSTGTSIKPETAGHSSEEDGQSR